jgi:Ca-activated chloride channel family protein
VVLDLSHSMNTADLKPSRLERAKFKIKDIFQQQDEGVFGLVVFAGDAFVISPLTRDGGTIVAMLQALQPGIMPAQGSRVDLGLLKAGELLKQAGRQRGEILLLADSYADARTIEAAAELNRQGFITSVLGIGTGSGAPLPTGQGGFARDAEGKVITTRLESEKMRALADSGGGDYVALSADNTDVRELLSGRVQGSRQRADDRFSETARWKETGPWLVLLLLPLAALAFRRGWLLSLCFLVISGLPAEPAMAYTMKDLWQRHDQQAYQALSSGDAETAATLSRDPMARGAAEFRLGNFDRAVQEFANAPGPDADYNRGNALAKLGKYEEAIKAYDEALRARGDMEDASFNKSLVEQLLQQQKAQQQKQQQNQGEGQNTAENQAQQEQADDSQQSNAGQQQAGQEESQDSGREGSSQQDGTSAASDDPDKTEAGQSAGQQQAQPEGDEQGNNAFSEAVEKMNQDNEATTGADTGLDQASAAEDDSRQAEQREEKSSTTTAAEQGMPGSAADVEPRANELDTEEQMAAEQWLRRIPDDPAGLLRRKLRYQYIQRGGRPGESTEAKPW